MTPRQERQQERPQVAHSWRMLLMPPLFHVSLSVWVGTQSKVALVGRYPPQETQRPRPPNSHRRSHADVCHARLGMAPGDREAIPRKGPNGAPAFPVKTWDCRTPRRKDQRRTSYLW